jgi:hypothetical protein
VKRAAGLIVPLAYLAGAGLVGWFLFEMLKRGKSAAAAASTVAAAVVDAVNPASPTNLAARAADAIAQTVTGDPGTTAGASLWERFNPAAVERERKAIYGDPAGTHRELTEQEKAALWGYPDGAAAQVQTDAAIASGSVDKLYEDLAAAWEGAMAESSRNNAQASGAAAFGIYPRASRGK